MKLTGTIAMFVAAGAAFAQPGPQGRGPGSAGASALDTNHDGTISSAEIRGAAASLKKLDRNGDGKLTEDEVRAAFGGPEGRGRGAPEGGAGGASPDELLETLLAFDRNKDGKLAKAEVPDRMQGLFTRGDANKDGVLTAAEIRGLATTQSASAPDRGGRQGRGGMMRMDPVMAALDVDHDGTVSAAEIRGASAALKPLDKNSDGQLTEDEIRPAFGRGGRGGRFGGGSPEEIATRIFVQADGNKDGRLSRDEMSEGPFGEMFERADSNKDGFVSKPELQNTIQQGGFGRGRGRGERPPQ